MLAAVGKPKSFADLAHYLIHGPRGGTPHPKRVAWLLTKNLPTDDPDLAAKLMEATAQLSARTKRAAYHLIIAWHPSEKPTLEEQQDIAALTLMMAGLDKHQALMVGHGDTAHTHLHILLNRVHPDTGRAWSVSHDYKRFDRILQDISEVYGYTPVPAHSFNLDLTETLPTQPTRRAQHAASRGAATTRTQWSRATSRALGHRLSESLDQATTWDDVAAAVASHGYHLEAKGKGLVVGNDQGYTKFSRLGLTTSAKALEKSFAETFTAYQQRTAPPPQPFAATAKPMFTVDAVDIARALGTREELQRAIAEAVGRRKAWIAQSSLSRQIKEDIKDVLKGTTTLTQRRPSASGSRKSSSPLIRSR